MNNSIITNNNNIKNFIKENEYEGIMDISTLYSFIKEVLDMQVNYCSDKNDYDYITVTKGTNSFEMDLNDYTGDHEEDELQELANEIQADFDKLCKGNITNIFILIVNNQTLYGELDMENYIIINNYTNFKNYPEIDFNELQEEINVKKNYTIIKYL